MFTFLIVIIALALIFDYINGFHDAANSIATVVSTKVLTPFQAVMWAAFFNFLAYFIFQDHAVANTIGKTVFPEFITLPVIFAGLIASIAWNLLTWWYGIPSSSSHTLIGGFAGAAVAHAYMTKGFIAFSSIVELEKITKTVLFIFLAPLVGMVISIFITLVTIMRNVWLRILIIIVANALTWMLFLNFQTGKIHENFSKLYQIDKYKKEVSKDPGEENKAKLEKAEAQYKMAVGFASSYESEGAEKVADEISASGAFKPLEANKVKQAINNTYNIDSLKRIALDDAALKPYIEQLTATVNKTKPYQNMYGTVPNAALADSLSAMLALTPGQRERLYNEIAKIDVRKDVIKELKKSDNSLIRYSIAGGSLIFILCYIYVDVLREPSASRKANMFKRLQLLSSAALSLGHGGSDAQKVMGIIAAAFVAYNGHKYPDTSVALRELGWVPLICYTAIAAGTLSGGWKIVKTMGSRITKVTPLEGVTAETAGAMTLFVTEQMGIPVSTTHTITGAIIGVGATKRLSAVRWGVTINLLWAWILTIPVSALLAGIFYVITSWFV
ncbi:MAG: inorganic phosphate transporter [Bacteroidetes bacterium]|nr:inorganic phosphate transporter [Bacteroidota bacterium]